jgi:hypothetical protein
MDSDVIDGALIDATLARLYTHVRDGIAAIGIEDVALQNILILTVVAGLLWIFVRYFSKVGYRINATFGMIVQVFTMGPLITFFLVTVRAWVVFRQPEITRAVFALFTP